MMNRVVLVGRLTKNPELRYTPAGVAVATFTLAVNRTFTNQQGEREADFINCVVWRKPAENVANFLRKGSMAGVDGRVQTRNYEGNDGKRVYVTEIVAESVQFLEPKSVANGGARASFPDESSAPPEKETNPSSNNPPSKPLEERKGPITVSDDDLPF
ncbi:single-stranded DNA-binding protein [Listeria innocua]|uniref:single-stranded DNA-binding protein n=1 Tax=Listeria innocua TaxID=1642 RepID=UPI0016235C57|nr:single-stranded DNA-binding protein [Listeria innocua]MBC2139664.1 single-stranded DNA-binding protein [Listeria innocua]